ncbi:MAG TPA: ribonuclease D [Spirochaetota bacterium]|nr:ribonuclease D [Spirochaetota bacterium]HPJ39012.1 ribonuclease D [Spirochaetota bacterium]HPQ52178.1 ribonuclease D [Spirochaetota bacterium]
MDTPIDYIDDDDQLRELAERLLSENIEELALDLEGEYNLHRYGMHLCLLQLYDGKRCYLIDPVAINDLSPFDLLLKSSIMIVMFSPHTDLLLLEHLFGYKAVNIFDTQTAARLCGHTQLALSRVIEAELGIQLNKSKRKQRANWCRRPIRQSLIEYAADDVLYLLELKKVLLQKLTDPEKLEELAEKNLEYENVKFRVNKKPYLSIKNSGTLDKNEKIYLKHFFNARDKIAQKIDRSPHNVLRNESLIAASQNAPKSREEWKSLEGLNPRAIPLLEIFIRAKERADRAVEEAESRLSRR